MNWKQKICMWIGIAVIVLMGLYPPWIAKDTVHGGSSQACPQFSFLMPRLLERLEFVLEKPPCQIHVVQLVIQWVVVAVVTGGLMVTFADKKPEDEQKQ